MLLIIALVLDFIFGEPKWLWHRVRHPVVVMGQCISWLDNRLNTGATRKSKGMLNISILCCAAGLCGYILSLNAAVACITVAIIVAHRSLVQHVSNVARGLFHSLGEGRNQVGKIVGRDTQTLDKTGIARAAIESCAENFSDGVVAPVFWYMVAGVPGLLIYKVVNTADSMIGHRTEKYEQFGWATARLDDLMNFVPARLTGALICLAGHSWTAWRTTLAEASLHRSPNAGWPEAAMAKCLGIRLGGARAYTGEVAKINAPWFNEHGRPEADTEDIYACIRLVNTGWLLFLLGLCLSVGISTGFAAF